jgi:hypothetical protein
LPNTGNIEGASKFGPTNQLIFIALAPEKEDGMQAH